MSTQTGVSRGFVVGENWYVKTGGVKIGLGGTVTAYTNPADALLFW